MIENLIVAHSYFLTKNMYVNKSAKIGAFVCSIYFDDYSIRIGRRMYSLQLSLKCMSLSDNEGQTKI